jgi:hypothetical protein
MSRDLITLPVADLSAFTRHLSRQLGAEGASAPTHQSLMNMLARAGGFRNLQHLRAARAAERRLDTPAPAQGPVDHALVARAMVLFDDHGVLGQWPARRAVQCLCLWALWARLPRQSGQSERQISAALNALHGFGDAALLRRDMVELGLLRRSDDCTDYARVERRPPPEALALIARLAARRSSPAPEPARR